MSIIRTRTITFAYDRSPSMRRIRLGFEGDNMVERIEFILPQIGENQTATLMMGGKYADAVQLTVNADGRYYVDLTAEIIGTDGEVESYVRIDSAGGEVWNSGVIRLTTGALPDVDTEIETRFPTAVETMLREIAGHREDMANTLQQAEEAAKRAEEAAANAGTGGGSGGGIAAETDPTVPDWAKQPEKPTYTAEEVGAQPAGDYALREELPEVPVQSVNGQTGAVKLTHEDVGADAKGSAETARESANAHADALIAELTVRLNALADSDDTTLDQLSEIVAYIKSNKGLIDAITTSKVSVSDIVDSLTSESANKPLSARQGAALKSMIEAIAVPTKVSELQNDAGYLTEHQDISGKLDADKLDEAVNSALAQAKASGEFDGAQGPQGEKGDTGAQGPQGEKGETGYTPVRGKDYWTEEDQEAITEEVSNQLSLEIADELAKRGQLKPEFANSIEECTDTTKLYVLPDGYIYAYTSMTGPMFTDLIPSSIDSDGTLYNGGLGYKTGYRLGAAVMTAGNAWEACQANDAPNGAITGLIPYNPANNKIIKACGWTTAYSANDYIAFYDANFNAIEQRGRLQYYVESYGQTFADEPAYDNVAKTFTFDIDVMVSKSSYYGNLIKDNAKYVAFSVQSVNLDALTVTFDEEIAFGTSSTWTNTGLAFVPADYEDRIVKLENTSENHETRIKTLEMYGAESVTSEEIPAYIKTAADEVISKVIDRQGNRSFNIVGISDFHYGGMGDNKDNLIRACKAISYIAGRIHVDAVATLGDNIPHGVSTVETLASGNRWFKEVNEILKMTEGENIAMFRTPGNHDRMGGNDTNGNPTEPIPDNSMYSYIGGYNRGCVIGNVPGGWAYRDFPGYYLRVIVLNTSETEGKGRFSAYSGYHMSSAQLKWLVNALDLSDKSDAAEWQILILSHHRADDWQAAATNATINNYIFPNILHAYTTGGSYTGVSAEDGATITCDFAGKNAAKLIGQIHGHHHAYYYQKLHLGAVNNSSQCNVMAISTPTSGFGAGAGHNDDNDGNYYDSVKDTAEETAFCVYCIDLDNHVIQAIHYGNGIDRVIAY